MMRYYVTFGVGYAQEAHPSFTSGRVPALRYAHPDNWIEVDAPDELAARLLVNETLGNNCWSNMLGEAEWNAMTAEQMERWFPGRCILVLRAEP